MSDRLGTGQGVDRRHDSRLYAGFAQGVLHQPIEVGGDDHSDEPGRHQCGDGVVCARGDLAAILTVLRAGFDVAVQNGAALIWRRGDLRKQL
ncbi:hypothetical protein D3C72_2047790 [compost metagenome]